MVVSVDHHVRGELREYLPEGAQAGVAAMPAAGAEQRVMPVGQGARHFVRRQILPQPLLLCGFGVLPEVTVQRHDVPPAEVIAVIAAARLPRAGARVARVGAAARPPTLLPTPRPPGALPRQPP